jgi:hypothetical protein
MTNSEFISLRKGAILKLVKSDRRWKCVEKVKIGSKFKSGYGVTTFPEISYILLSKKTRRRLIKKFIHKFEIVSDYSLTDFL